MTLRMLLLAASVAVAALPRALAQEPSTPPGMTYRSETPPAERQVYFGELHLHTTMSLDAWTYGTKITPDQAYKFARGDTVMVPAIQVSNEEGVTTGDVPARRAWPLDFTAVTDHSEYMGAMHQLDDPNSAFVHSAAGEKILAYAEDLSRTGNIKSVLRPLGPPALRSVQDAAVASNAWDVETTAANDNYQPGKFTTFIAYEWSAQQGRGITMHRNVIFNGDHAPKPFTSLDSNHPEDLWKYLDAARAKGVDVIAIPHNSNKSKGRDFDWNMSDGRPIDEAYAQERALNEPLVEIAQHKGTSETAPDLSPDDEFADYDLLDKVAPTHHGSFVREAFGRGLIIQSKVGTNPFKMGIVGASDFHNGLSASGESAYAGEGPYGIDPRTMTPSRAVAQDALLDKDEQDGEGGKHNPVTLRGAAITGVWAERNDRNAIFAALKRKETFGTSGTRIRVRMFGGWDFTQGMLKHADWVSKAYADGVPMGGDMPSRPATARAPSFILQATKDPDGANLDRIQVVKVWLEGGTYKEKVFDVALSGGRRDDASGHAPAVGNTVDLNTGDYKNTIGAPVLMTTWRDPQFDPANPAVYYARVLEIPTARWSTLLAIREHLPLSDKVPATVQDRAWTSPIWFTPARS